jgi:hypothetical protein
MHVKFSIITISFNHAEFIEKTITSVLEQNYPNFEHIIIDGGSTDDTVSILKKYPHLNWVSEKDSGVSNALNKGFKKATGDIIGWLNSDDFYTPNAFNDVLKAINNGPIVLGDSIEADRQGNPIQTVNNVPRTIYDLHRYWVPKGWLAQPSVFFTRDALYSVALPNGDLIDESFKYSMDYDLWLRLATKYKFDNYIPTPLSSFRVYGENLTGRAFASPQRELGRAFRASLGRLGNPERSHAFVLPVLTIDEPLSVTLQSLFAQQMLNFDIIFVDCTKTKEERKALLQTVQTIEESTTQISLRIVNATPGCSYYQGLIEGLRANTAQTVTCISAGDTFATDTTVELSNMFAHDPYGICLHVPFKSELGKKLVHGDSQILRFNNILEFQPSFYPFSIRAIALKEVGLELLLGKLPLQMLLMNVISKGWIGIIEDEKQLITHNKEYPIKSDKFLEQQRAFLFTSINNTLKKDIFYPTRSESAYAPQLPEQAVAYAESVIKNCPDNWDTVES